MNQEYTIAKVKYASIGVDTDAVIDVVESYFALRDVSLTKRALTVNGKPVFMRFKRDGTAV